VWSSSILRRNRLMLTCSMWLSPTYSPPPYALEQQILCDDASRVLRQVGEDAVLRGRQRDLAPAQRDQMLRVVIGAPT
jgi:hypothetical protein